MKRELKRELTTAEYTQLKKDIETHDLYDYDFVTELINEELVEMCIDFIDLGFEKDIILNTHLQVYGISEYDLGDYFTAPSCEVEVTDVEVCLNEQVLIDAEEFYLTREQVKEIEQILENQACNV